MRILVAVLLMQYVVSVRAGLVNHVQGDANVVEMKMVEPGAPIRTGADGYTEILLTPGSFLRLGENSEAVLEGVDLENVQVRVLKGPAVIEVIEISRDYPIRVTTGNLTALIPYSGIYRFADGVATVLEGKLQTGDEKLTYAKGWQVFFQDTYRARKIGKPGLTSLDLYSDSRSESIAFANLNLASQVRNSTAYWDSDYWVFAPFLGAWTYLPRSSYRSPYGYKYHGAGGGRGETRGGRGGVATSGAPAPTRGGSPAPPVNPGSNGGTNDSGGGATASAPVVATPSGERTTPSVYIESKSSPVGATQ